MFFLVLQAFGIIGILPPRLANLPRVELMRFHKFDCIFVRKIWSLPIFWHLVAMAEDPSDGRFEGFGDGPVDAWEQNPTVDGPKTALGFPDRREERNRCGLIRFKLENGVPDVGGLGWRSRAGHLLKNQTFFASRPGENQWNNPTHAGPRTWRSYHGPKLRTDADLMERMDRVEGSHAVWEAKKAFVNTAPGWSSILLHIFWCFEWWFIYNISVCIDLYSRYDININKINKTVLQYSWSRPNCASIQSSLE